MPPKLKDGRRKGGSKAKTKAERKKKRGRADRSREKETPAKRKAPTSSSSPRPNPSVAATRTSLDREKKKGNQRKSAIPAIPDDWIPSPAFKLAATILSSCHQGTWWRLTPDLNGIDDVAIASRQSWDNILPVFIEAGLFGTREVGDTGTEYRLEIIKKGWDTMAVYLKKLSGTKLERTLMSPKRGRNSWHIILSDADSKTKHKHSSPIVQQIKTKGGSLITDTLLRSKTGDDEEVMRQLVTLKKKIDAKNLLHRMQNATAEAWDAVIEAAGKMGTLKSNLLKEVATDETLVLTSMSTINVNTPQIANALATATSDIEKQIDDALNLDFDIRLHDSDLRPSRVGNDGIDIRQLAIKLHMTMDIPSRLGRPSCASGGIRLCGT